MPTYQYKGLGFKGEQVNGVIDAASESDAASKIKTRCPVIIGMTEMKEKSTGAPAILKKKISAKELTLLCSQFSIILSSGISIVKCIHLIEDQNDDKAIKKMLHTVSEHVESGRSLTQSFSEFSAVLPAVFIETIRAGEESGTLDAAFKKLQKYFDSSSKVISKVKGALVYPVIVLSVAAIVIIFIMVYAVPTFTKMFDQMGGQLPGITKALISFSGFMQKNFILIILLIAGIIIGLKVYGNTKKRKICFIAYKT